MTAQTKQEALDIIAGLAVTHQLTADDITARLIVDGTTTIQGQRSILMKLLSYLGGLLIFAGLGIFVAMQWDGMSSAAVGARLPTPT